jgi:RNA polymerase sigma factor (sigma-70 family)
VTDEAALVERLRRGEAAAFDAVYNAHRARLFTFLSGLAGQRALAEDLLQETFLRLARSAFRLAPDTRLAPWLYRVARNLFLSQRRWARRELERLGRLELLPVPANPTPLEHAAAGQLEQRVSAALACLPAAHREVLLLATAGRLEPGEIAEVLDLTPEAARQRLSRARTALAEAADAPRRPR